MFCTTFVFQAICIWFGTVVIMDSVMYLWTASLLSCCCSLSGLGEKLGEVENKRNIFLHLKWLRHGNSNEVTGPIFSEVSPIHKVPGGTCTPDSCWVVLELLWVYPPWGEPDLQQPGCEQLVGQLNFLFCWALNWLTDGSWLIWKIYIPAVEVNTPDTLCLHSPCGEKHGWMSVFAIVYVLCLTSVWAVLFLLVKLISNHIWP